MSGVGSQRGNSRVAQSIGAVVACAELGAQTFQTHNDKDRMRDAILHYGRRMFRFVRDDSTRVFAEVPRCLVASRHPWL